VPAVFKIRAQKFKIGAQKFKIRSPEVQDQDPEVQDQAPEVQDQNWWGEFGSVSPKGDSEWSRNPRRGAGISPPDSARRQTFAVTRRRDGAGPACAEHARQLGSESLPPNLMEVKG